MKVRFVLVLATVGLVWAAKSYSNDTLANPVAECKPKVEYSQTCRWEIPYNYSVSILDGSLLLINTFGFPLSSWSVADKDSADSQVIRDFEEGTFIFGPRSNLPEFASKEPSENLKFSPRGDQYLRYKWIEGQWKDNHAYFEMYSLKSDSSKRINLPRNHIYQDAWWSPDAKYVWIAGYPESPIYGYRLGVGADTDYVNFENLTFFIYDPLADTSHFMFQDHSYSYDPDHMNSVSAYWEEGGRSVLTHICCDQIDSPQVALEVYYHTDISDNYTGRSYRGLPLEFSLKQTAANNILICQWKEDPLREGEQLTGFANVIFEDPLSFTLVWKDKGEPWTKKSVDISPDQNFVSYYVNNELFVEEIRDSSSVVIYRAKTDLESPSLADLAFTSDGKRLCYASKSRRIPATNSTPELIEVTFTWLKLCD